MYWTTGNILDSSALRTGYDILTCTVHAMLTCSGIHNKESLLVLDTIYHNNTTLADERCAKIKLKNK